MPIRPPVLDDRSYDDLVAELLARIPAHTPEWTDPRPGDPGRTLIELFAWLADTLLYRANLIPERQRLAFLRLLGIPLRPAVAARGLVTLTSDARERTDAFTLRPHGLISKPVPFETLGEITVLPVMAEAYCKRPLTARERADFAAVLPGLERIYGLAAGQAQPYVTTPVFPGGAADLAGFDLAKGTVDGALWFALLTLKDDPSPEFVNQVRATLGTGSQLLNVGVAPALAVPGLSEEIGPRAHIPFRWEISYLPDPTKDAVDYMTLPVVPGSDTTAGLTRRGVMRLALPAAQFIAAPPSDPRQALAAGIGERPPRLDDPRKQARLVAWLRLRPAQPMNNLALSWAGINAVEIDQRQTLTGRIVGQGTGVADLELQLPARSVEPETLQIEVAEPGAAYRPWRRIEDLALAGRDDPVYSLDAEAGTIRFGDGVRGRIPPVEARVRVAQMRAGGGRGGNLPPGALTEINAALLDGSPVPVKLKVGQSLPTEGGEDAETLAEAEGRIPAIFRHRDRAVTEEDYRSLAAATPGVRLGRVEVLRRFKPHQRRPNVPGVVSVMVLPAQIHRLPPNPRPDRPTLEAVFAHLDARRPLTTELYVIGPEYVPLGVSVSVAVREDFGREAVTQAVRDAVRGFLWPLAPGGLDGDGWPLGGTVRDRQIEVAVARVPGVLMVNGVKLFDTADGKPPKAVMDWRKVAPATVGGPAEKVLSAWQLPELLVAVVDAEQGVAPDLSALDGLQGGVGNVAPGANSVPVPVVPEVC